MGIVCVYLYQGTLFVACLALDERRKRAGRSALIPCVKTRQQPEREDATADDSLPDKQSWLSRVRQLRPLRKYGMLLSQAPVQAAILLFTAGFLALSIYGNIELKQEFDPWMFLSDEDQLKVWKRVHESSFPKKGRTDYSLLLYCSLFKTLALFAGEKVLILSEGGGAEPFNVSRIEWMVEELAKQEDIINKVDSWYSVFKSHYQANFQPTMGNRSLSQLTWPEVKERLAQFFFTPAGLEFQYMFSFASELKCGATDLPDINTHVMSLDHVVIDNSIDGISAMNRVKAIVKAVNVDKKVFPYSLPYSVWEIDEVIRGELYRNLGLATLAIYLATLLLLSDVTASLFCLFSVILTLANVAGVMYFWGLTIDTGEHCFACSA